MRETSLGSTSEWFAAVSQQLREIRRKSLDAEEESREERREAADTIQSYLRSDVKLLKQHWTIRRPEEELRDLARHVHFGMLQDYHDILRLDLVQLEERAIGELLKENPQEPEDFETLLHPVVKDAALKQFKSNHLRDAVLNAFIGVFDFIRKRTGLDLDGDRLVTQVFSLDRPHLVLSDLQTESGRNDQVGFMQIMQGTYKAVRNPKAHSLQHDLTKSGAAQYLVFASLLARRVDEARGRDE